MSLDSASIGSKRLSGRVPSDQKCLLKSQGSWAADLGNQPCSPTHIPGHITEAAKSAHRTQEEESEVQTIQSKKRRATSPMSPTGSKRVQNNDATAPKSNSDGLPQSSPGESIPWSCNPAREQPGLVASECTATSMANQSPLDVAGGSGLRQGQHPSISASPDLPSSESEYRMETKIPDARPLLDTCIRREVAHSSQSMPSPLSTKQPRTTPPCAQLINYTKSSGHDAGARDGMSSNVKKRAEGCENLLPSEKIDVDGSDEEMMKDFPGKDHLRHTTMAPASGSPAPTSSSESLMPVVYDIPLMQDIVRGSTQVNETGTPSAAMRDIMGRSPSYPLMSAANPDPLADAETGSCQDKLSVRRDQERQIKAHQIQRPSTMTLNSPPRRTASTSSRQPSATNRIPTRLPSPAQPCIAPGAHCEPFETFVQYYPEYASGDGGQVAAATKSDFMTACVYLNYLRSRNKLQEGLYDEFIRTFPRYYNKYLDKCRTQGRKPLIAVAWFNKQTGPLIFDKYLVYRRNLSHILRMYPYEFEMIKEKLEDGGGGDVVIYTSSEDEGDISEGQGTASPVSVQRGEKAPEASPPIASLESQPGKTLCEILPELVIKPVGRLSAAAGTGTKRGIQSDGIVMPGQRPRPMPHKVPGTTPEQRSRQISGRVSEDGLMQRSSAGTGQPLERRPGRGRTLPSSFKTPDATLTTQHKSSRPQDSITQAPPLHLPKTQGESVPPPSSIPEPTPVTKDPRWGRYFKSLAARSRAPPASGDASAMYAMDDDRRRERLLKHFRKHKADKLPRTEARTDKVQK